ncbi:MAG: stage sporulation protein [Candidatus Eremiobacteraeota bacterium]|nr:stage sporulation protein [Candidatus Eremiobacteraeota bacterium]
MAARAFARVAPLRAKISLVLVVALALALALRLANLQLREGPKLAHAALLQHGQTVESFAKRGAILDRNGGVLVRSLPSESIYTVPGEVTDPHAVAAKLAPLLRKPAAALDLALADKKTDFRWLARKVPHDVAERIDALQLAGIYRKGEDTGIRFVASGRLASTVVGFTGTEENGLDGLEYSLDKLLRGTPGRTRIEADQFGRAIPFGETHVIERAVAGSTIITTLDPYLQFETERLLRASVKKWSARSGTAIVMDPWTGELLAVANVPDFDPAHFGAFTSDAWKNRAISDAFEPGSTFKLITAAAALESGKFAANVRFPARDSLHIGGQTIHNAEDGMMAAGRGSESIEEIIAFSHNVGAAEIGLATGPRAMYRTIRKFGFGDGTAVELPGENPGIVTDPKDWSGSSLATISFGHGISTTPIALARAYAAIANGGLLMRPRIVSAIQDANGKQVYRYGPAIEQRAISAKTAATLRRYLRAAVVRGTGNPTAHVPGYTTAGKTGTAQVVENGGYLGGAYIASFIGMIPAERPRYVILVKVERPHGSIYGSQVAAPVFADLARAAMFHAGVMPAVGAPRAATPRSHSAAAQHTAAAAARLVRAGHGAKDER